MISIDDHAPSDPSSAHHNHQQHHHQQQQNSHDLKVSDTDLKSTDADLDDTNNPLPNFSIRDYVFGLRSKDIACNWPFSSTSLQLCLKHGVKNLLPPFQSLDCLRNNSSLTKCTPENHLTDEELISSFDGKPANDQSKSNKKTVTTNPSGSKGDKESQFHLQEQLGQTRSKEKPPSSLQKPGNASVSIVTKKARFVIKVNSGVEHVAPNSETMASKVCPVCKIFTSSSNTTLNAHIDQCLTGEGTMKWTENPKVIVKHKVKPRKMRLMVDVYKTAPHCTIEELDRRNGTSWATNSSFPAQEFQFQGEEEEEEQEEEEEKEEPRLTKVNPQVADNEGDVYIDTNGTKVRILSVPKTGSSNNLEGGRLPKGVKGGKLIKGKKNNLFKKKHHKKYLKLTPNVRHLCSQKPKIVDDPAKSGQAEEDVVAEHCSKDKRGKEIMKVVDLGVSRLPWACSKRTGLSEKYNGKNRKVELKCHKMRDLVVENYDKSFSEKNRSLSQSRKKMITSLSLTKQPHNRLVKFRKEATPMHDDDDDDEDVDGDGSSEACTSQYSDDDDDFEGSSDADNRSKGSKFSSLSRNLSFPAAKLSFKRKFSAVKKSCVKSVDGPSQHSDDDDDDSEGTPHADNGSKGSKFSSLSRNLSFPAAKFSFKRKFSAVEKSCVRSIDEPSQDPSREQCRIEEDTDINKKLETRSITSKSSNEESSVGIQTVNGNELESVRNGTLSSIRAPSFMGLSTSLIPGFSNQECIELYQDQICSTNRAPNDVEKQDNYFQEIDPIPIPGPPGSLLPASPGGEMVSEEQIQETIVPSSENKHHHDTIDQDSMSNSPASTVSNSRSSCGKDDMYTKPYFNGDAGFTEMGQSQSSFKNDQPCCCSRKEAALNYQDSYILRKQPTESKNFKSEMFPVRNYPNSSGIDSTASPSKPVLRLMGKNLTLVETDDDESRPSQSSQQQSQRPVIFDQYQDRFGSQHFNAHPSRSHVDFGPVYPDLTAPMDCYGDGGPFLGPVRSCYIHNVLDSHAVSGRSVYNVASGSRPVKEIVIIDDSPENDDDDRNTMRNTLLKGNQGQMSPLYTMYPSYVGGSTVSSVFHGGSLRTLDNENVGGKWNIGSSTAHHPPSYP